MSELICDTTVVQYLHQIGRLHILPVIASQVAVPTAVADELTAGHARGIALPDLPRLAWLQVLSPNARPALPDASELGAGECEVLWLAMEHSGRVAVLDDSKARQVAARMKIPMTGTLGLLLDAKRAGLIPAIAPLVGELRQCNFYITTSARALILRQAGEAP